MNRRQSDRVIVNHRVDPNVHGGTSEKNELDPNNRGSVVLGSIADYMDRYGYDVQPLALRLLAGETVPPRTVTHHILVRAANVLREYRPVDVNWLGALKWMVPSVSRRHSGPPDLRLRH